MNSSAVEPFELTIRVCAGGAGLLLAATQKLRPVGLTLIELLWTSRLTGMLVVGFDAAGAVTWMLPAHVAVVVGNITVLIETMIGVGVEPFVAVVCTGVTINQLPQFNDDPLGVKFT